MNDKQCFEHYMKTGEVKLSTKDKILDFVYAIGVILISFILANIIILFLN